VWNVREVLKKSDLVCKCYRHSKGMGLFVWTNVKYNLNVKTS
jgi:hypothetical protein